MNPVCIKIQGSVTIDDCAADVLYYITSYALVKPLREQFGNRFTETQIEKALQGIRSDLRTIVDAKKAAVDAVVEKFNGKANQ